MYIGHQYGNIYLALFNKEITLADIELFSSDIQSFSEKEEALYLIALPIDVTSFPTGLSPILQSLSVFKSAISKVSRFYGIRYSPIMTFISNLASQVLKIKTNTVEAKSIEELFAIIEKEAALYPKLQESLQYLPEIKAHINTLQKTS